MSTDRAVIIAARRTVIGRQGGLHARRTIDQLMAPVIQAVLADAGVAGNDVDQAIVGNAVGGGGNPARLVALAAGLPVSLPALTVDTQCASGLDAAVTAARLIETGGADIVIAGGVESASTAPWRVARPANPYADLPQFYSQADFAPGQDAGISMIEAAENIARDYEISQERQDTCALLSHLRAVEAGQSGALHNEIVALGKSAQESRDECPRAAISEALLARMPPLTGHAGTVTAGNSCQINDGAAALVMVSGAIYAKLGSPPGLIMTGAASGAIEPRILGLAAVPAARTLEKRIGKSCRECDAIEINEAFAAQMLATADALGLGEDRINTLGGALAYGHPYGASGAILLVRLFTRLVRRASPDHHETGLVLIAAAGGIGTAARLERVG